MLDLGSVACTRPQTVRMLTPAGPQSRLVQKAPTLGGEACEQRLLRASEAHAPPAGREDGSRCWVSVGTSEFSGHLELVHLGGVIYVISALAAGCLITPAPRGSRYRPWLVRPGRAVGAARAAEPGGEGRSSVSPPGRQSSVAERTRTRSQRRRSSQPRPVLSSRESQAPWNFSQPPLPYLRGGGAVA